MKTIKITATALTVFMIAWLQPGKAIAQANVNGEATISYLRFDNEGNRSSARELYNTYDGFNFQNLWVFGDLNKHTRYSLNLNDIGFDGRRAALNLTDIDLFKLKFDYRQSRLLYGVGTDSKNSRKAYSGSLEVKPLEMVSAFVDYQGYKNEGDRIVADTNGTGLFGAKYDRTSSTIKGELKGRYKTHQLEVAYGQRKYDDKNDSLDSKTNYLDFHFYGRINPKLKAVFHYDYAKKKLNLPATEQTDNAFGATVLYRPSENLTVMPTLNYRAVNGGDDSKYTAYRFGFDAEYVTPFGTNLFGGIGYEGRKTSNDEDAKSNLLYYSIGGKTKFSKTLAARVVYKGETRKDPDKVLITGVEDKTRILAELEITPCKNAELKAGYKMSDRENSDINTKARVGSLYGTLDTRCCDKADISLQGNITNVKYNWDSQELKYRYNSITGSLNCHPTGELTISAGLTYFIFKEDVQQDKVDIMAGAHYQFISRAKFGVSYRRYEFDNTLWEPARFRADLIKAELTVNFATD